VKPKKPKRKQKRCLNKKKAFLAAISITGSITESALATKINRHLHYDWMKLDPLYPARFSDAKAMGDDALEDEARLRATKGVYEPNVFQGKFIFPREQYIVTPAIPAGDWKDEGAKPETPAVMGWRDVPGALPLGTWKKSDGLLTTLLRGAFPKYRQGAVEVTGKDGTALIPEEFTVNFVRPKPTDDSGHSGGI
jgi:hypothetical protein